MTSAKFRVVLAFFFGAAIWVSGESPLQARRRAIEEFSVMGEVIKPGKYELRKGMTSLQALALAQGATKDADVDRTVIYRQKDAAREPEEIKLDWRAVMRREKKDVELLANDTIFVPRK